MNITRNTNAMKSLTAILIAVLLFTATIGNAFAAGHGALGLANDVTSEDPDPGIVKGFIYVYEIDFKVGSKIVYGTARVLDQSNRPVEGANVSAIWTFPDGTQMKMQGQTNSSGIAVFIVEKTSGEHKLEIEDVQLKDIIFNTSASQLVGAVVVGK